MHGTGQSGTRKGPERSRVGLEYRARGEGRGGGMGGGVQKVARGVGKVGRRSQP